MKTVKIEYTLTGWAGALGIDHKTLARNWVKVGFKSPNRGDLLTAKDVFKAMTGDWQVARTRAANADADLAELKAEEKRNGMIPTVDVQTFIHATFGAIRPDVLNLPAVLASKANPEHPEVARAALLEWADTFLARRRENIPQFKIEEP